jgi:hypothetical protein
MAILLVHWRVVMHSCFAPSALKWDARGALIIGDFLNGLLRQTARFHGAGIRRVSYSAFA